MTLYFDTSSLLKFHIEEEGSESVRHLMASRQPLAMSRVAYPEARSGLARAYQAGRLNDTEYGSALGTFELQWVGVVIIEVSDGLSLSAGNLAERYLLRGFDAIHLASALAFQDSIGEPVTFSAWDDRLLAAAQAERLSVAPITVVGL